METAPLASLCRLISSGGTPSRNHPEYFADDEGHPWVKSQELVDRPIYDTMEKISDIGLARSSAKYYEADTVLIAMYGATVGKLAILRVPATVNQAICALCVDPAFADHRYVFYALMATRRDLTMQAAGAAQQNLNQSLIRDFEVPVFPLDKQRRIAAVLGNLDDLIENNWRRVSLLEEMARMIYREWFLTFRFPGHEDVDLTGSELGRIPIHWEVTSLADHVHLKRRNLMPGNSSDEKFDHYSIPAFDERRMPTAELGSEIKSGKYQLDVDCVLLSKLNPRFPRVWRVHPGRSQLRSICSTEFLVLEADGDWPGPFVFSIVGDSNFGARLASMASGTSTSHQRAKPGDVMALRLAGPPAELVAAFCDRVASILDLADNLVFQNDVLSKARDMLLPRLISGELDPWELDLDRSPVV